MPAARCRRVSPRRLTREVHHGRRFAVEVPELIDEFVGDWRVVELAKKGIPVELGGAEPARFKFLEDDTGELQLAGIDGYMRCRFGETLDGLPMVRFKWEGHVASKEARGTGFGMLYFDDDMLRGEVKVNRRVECWFVARRERPRVRPRYLA